MSTDAQLKGDSLRRQLDASAKYAADHGLDLLEEATLKDIGVSAYDGTNLESGALGKFIEAVRAGRVKAGSYLLVESFDRLSRQPPMIALQLFMEIMNSGITLVTLSDNQVYTAGTSDLQQLIISIVVMSRSNEESLRKSERISQAWAAKRRNIGLLKLTKRCPGWLKLSGDKKSYEIIEERAAVVRRIFDDTIAGIGCYSITRRLNAENVPTFGLGTDWGPSSVNKIVVGPAVIGQFQPGRKVAKKRFAEGDPIKGYFPSVITDEIYFAAQAARLGRRTHGGGRTGKFVSNLFTKLAHCEYCDGRMHYQDKGEKPKGGRYLVCSTFLKGAGCTSIRWRYEHFEGSFLSFVEELDLGSLFTQEADAVKRAATDSKIKALDGQILLLKQEREKAYDLIKMPGVNMGFVTEKLVACEARLNDVESDRHAEQVQLALLLEAAATYYQGGDQIKDLIGRVRSKTGNDTFKARSQIVSRLKALITKIQVAPAGIVPDHEKYIEWSKLNGQAVDQNAEPFERKRYFRVIFRNGSSRMVYPNSNDPLKFDYQFYTDVEQQSDLIHPDGVREGMTVVIEKQRATDVGE
ncbi:MAG: recombinase family protein [Tardiphaga sp.]|nr:recombinase family protein [Tardiphaga sp.]